MTELMTEMSKSGKRKVKIGTLLVQVRSLSVFIIFALLFFVFFILSPGHRFVSKDNLDVFLALGAEFNIVALAVGMLMISGEFDLSVGSVLVFCSFVFLKLFEVGLPVLVAAILTVVVGGIIGYIHGSITVKAKIPSFITTLGGMMFWRGVTLFWSGGLQKPLETESFSAFTAALTGKIWNFLPVQFVWFIGIMLILMFIVQYHKFGNWIYTTGDNPLAARAMGINTDRVKIICFIVVSFICSFVAVMQIARIGVFTSRAGDGWELKAIAASVVGGTALSGGIGTIFGVFWGALVISIIENGLVVLRIPYAWTYTVFGVVIISSVLIGMYIEKRQMMLGAERT